MTRPQNTGEKAHGALERVGSREVVSERAVVSAEVKGALGAGIDDELDVDPALLESIGHADHQLTAELVFFLAHHQERWDAPLLHLRHIAVDLIGLWRAPVLEVRVISDD